MTSVVQQHIGKELIDDPEFQRRVAAGKISLPAVTAASAAPISTVVEGTPTGNARSVVATEPVTDPVPAGAGSAAAAVPAGGARSAYLFL